MRPIVMRCRCRFSDFLVVQAKAALLRSCLWILLAVLLMVPWGHALAASGQDLNPWAKQFFPQADALGAFAGDPPAAPVYQDGKEVGYLFVTDDVVRIPAYSGKPIKVLVGIDLNARITGVRILEHQEPILLVGVTNRALERFTGQYQGKSVTEPTMVGGKSPGFAQVDGITGATITAMVINASIMRAARMVATSRDLIHTTGFPQTEVTDNLPSGPLWAAVWQERGFRIGVLIGGLAFLLVVLVFQDWLARHPSLLLYVRDGYLLFTVIFIGWYALAQLSVVNVLTFVHAIMHEFRWEAFLIDPMIFILWSFVAMTLLLWGRGVYCGWLCPYGALQELTNQLSRRFKLPQLEFPEMVHERMWAVKYVILLVLFGISLQSLGAAERYAEIEPFKTAITLRFQREWGFAFYAAGLVVVSAFNRKFFCKYLCPLGAALAIPARLRLFDWLRRRKECGRPCQSCAIECEVRAIRPTGEINANECHYCLDCQVTYWNDHKCPPLVERRRRHAQSRRARESVREMEQTLGLSGIDDFVQKTKHNAAQSKSTDPHS